VKKIERTIVVEGGDQRAIWDYLADYTTTDEWDPPTQTTDRISGDGGVGTTTGRSSIRTGSRSSPSPCFPSG